MDTVWTKNASCHTLRKNTSHTAGTKRKKCHTLRKNTRHTAGTKCHKILLQHSTHYDVTKSQVHINCVIIPLKTRILKYDGFRPD